jgi:hypothetical protein
MDSVIPNLFFALLAIGTVALWIWTKNHQPPNGPGEPGGGGRD